MNFGSNAMAKKVTHFSSFCDFLHNRVYFKWNILEKLIGEGRMNGMNPK